MAALNGRPAGSRKLGISTATFYVARQTSNLLGRSCTSKSRQKLQKSNSAVSQARMAKKLCISIGLACWLDSCTAEHAENALIPIA